MSKSSRIGAALLCLSFAVCALALTASGQSGWPILVFVEAIFDGAGGVVDGLDGSTSVTMSPDGKHVYVAGNGESAVPVFARNSSTGALTFVEVERDGVNGVHGIDYAYAVAVSPDGKNVYVAGNGSHSVAVFSRDSTTGGLSWVEVQQAGVGSVPVDSLFGTTSVTVSPDGDYLYATGNYGDSVTVFARHASGTLYFVEVVKNTDFGVSGLYGAYHLAVSPDGKHLYVASIADDAVAVFSRNATTGKLTFLEAHQDGVDGVDGLDGTSSVGLSQDGRNLYASGLHEDAVAVFSRNVTTGKLTFLEVHRDGVAGVDGLDGPYSVTLSPDDKYLYAVGFDDDTVVVFARNSESGKLSFLQALWDGRGGVDGLDGSTFLTPSPDGRHLYVTGGIDDAVVTLLVSNLGIFKAEVPLVSPSGPITIGPPPGEMR